MKEDNSIILKDKNINLEVLTKKHYTTENKKIHTYVHETLVYMKQKASIETYGITFVFPELTVEGKLESIRR